MVAKWAHFRALWFQQKKKFMGDAVFGNFQSDFDPVYLCSTDLHNVLIEIKTWLNQFKSKHQWKDKGIQAQTQGQLDCRYFNC